MTSDGNVYITPDELNLWLETSDAPIVLDATYLLSAPEFDGDYRYRNASALWAEQHIPNSIYVDVNCDFSDASSENHFQHPTSQQVIDKLASLGISQTKPVVVYDALDGIWAARIWLLLHWIGHEVYILQGGISAWLKNGFPVSDVDTKSFPVAQSWIAEDLNDIWLSTSDIESHLKDHKSVLMCALSSQAYFGQVPTRYTSRGHIPSSVNVPARELAHDDGTPFTKEELSGIFKSLNLSTDQAQEIWLYCGGGISAALSFAILINSGYRNVKIYDGSLEEWSRLHPQELVTNQSL